MGGPRALGLLRQMGLLLLALASGPSSAEEDQGAPGEAPGGHRQQGPQGRGPSSTAGMPDLEGAHFLYQERAECHFAAAKASSSSQGKGTGREEDEEEDPPEMRFLQRVIYDRQEVMRFDSALGHYLALAPMAESNVTRLNKDQAQLQAMMDNVEACWHNYGVIQAFALRRRIQPKLKITPTDYDSSSHNIMLICSVDSFFPPKINVTWLRNGKKEDKWMTADLTDNGDWTYGIHAMLETKLERGDVYTCQVEHATFASPASVQWEPQSHSARSKKWTGVVGIVFGVVFVAAGLSVYLRNKKAGHAAPQTTVGLMD